MLIGGRIFAALVGCLLLASCITARTQVGAVGPAPQVDDVPRVVAVLPARFAQGALAGKEAEGFGGEAEFVAGLSRSVVRNQLVGKGYAPIHQEALDAKLVALEGRWEDLPPADLCRSLGVEGVVFVDITQWTMVTAAAVDVFDFAASVTMADDTGRTFGPWSASAEKRRFSIPTSIISAVATLVESVLADPIRQQFRHVVYDWGWRVSQGLPDCREGRKLPEIKLVESNVDRRVFGIGARVTVKVRAEGNLAGSFNIGDFKRNIPLRAVADGEYEGRYVVREGDRVRDAVLSVRMVKPSGLDREWVEAEAAVTIDGIPPQEPEDVEIAAETGGIRLHWRLPEGEELAGFVVERNDNPVGEFTTVGRLGESRFLDAEVRQGATYYYRVRSVDGAANLSRPGKPLEAVMPQFEETDLASAQGGTRVTGNYRVPAMAGIPDGKTLTVMAGSRIRFAPGAGLDVAGKLVVKGRPGAEVVLEGENWRGLMIRPSGRADISGAVFRGCSSVASSLGNLRLEGVDAVGEGEEVAVSLEGGRYELKDVDLSGWKIAVLARAGEGSIEQCGLAGNDVGLSYQAGELFLEHNNIHDNACNVDSRSRFVLGGNYLGTVLEGEARVAETVFIRSLLDAPYPGGELIELADAADMSPERLEERFQACKARGMKAFSARKYGDAYQQLRKALRLKADRDAYLYMAYTQLELGEPGRMAETLEKAIESYPYDYRLQQAYVRHLLGIGENERALASVRNALRLDPGNENIKFLLEYVQEESQRRQAQPAAE